MENHGHHPSVMATNEINRTKHAQKHQANPHGGGGRRSKMAS
jgi:hypothetical protein